MRHVIVAAPLLALLAFLLLAVPGNAEETGPCTGTINGHDIDGTVTVPENGTVAWQFTSTGGSISAWCIELLFLGNAIPIDEGEDEEPDQKTKGGVANVNQYATYGVGIYQLTGTVVTENGPCTGSVDIVVQGNPLTTVMGAAGATATVVGAGGAAAASAIGAKSAAAAALKP